MTRKSSESFPLLLVAFAFALVFLFKTVFDQYLTVALMNRFRDWFGPSGAEVIARFAALGIPCLLAIAVIAGLYRYLYWELMLQLEAARQALAREQKWFVDRAFVTLNQPAISWLRKLSAGEVPRYIPDEVWRSLEATGLVIRDYAGPKGIKETFKPFIVEKLKEPVDISEHYPNVCIGDSAAVIKLLNGDDRSRFLGLLSSGTLASWARPMVRGNPSLVRIPAAMWESHIIEITLAGGDPRWFNQTFFRTKTENRATHYDVHLNLAQLKRTWPDLPPEMEQGVG